VHFEMRASTTLAGDSLVYCTVGDQQRCWLLRTYKSLSESRAVRLIKVGTGGRMA
jgi:hypothetical protein